MGIGFHRSRRQIGGALLKESERAHKSACRNSSFIIEDPTNVPRLTASSQSRENYLVWSSFFNVKVALSDEIKLQTTTEKQSLKSPTCMSAPDADT